MKVTHLILALAALSLAVACTNPANNQAPTTGSITGLALYKGLSNNGGIAISAESVDSTGKTLAVARSISTRSMPSRAIAARATTSASGAYSLSSLAAGTYTIYASSPNSLEKAVYTGVTVTAGKSVSAADLDLTPTGSISGKATLAGAASGNLGILVYVAGTSYSALTADDGSYAIAGLPVGSDYLLVASCQGYDSSSPQSLSVSAGTATTASKIDLVKHVTPATTGSVSGSATLSGQAADANAGIFVFLSGSSSLAMTDSSGAYSLSGVAPGSYSLVASKQGYDTASESVTASAGATTTASALNLVAPVSFTAFGILSPYAQGLIDEKNKTISLTLPYGTSLSSLSAFFVTSATTVKVGSTPQTSGSTWNDFSHPLTYDLTGADGQTSSYTVTASDEPNTAKALLSFSFPSLGVTGTIDEGAKTIAVDLLPATPVTGLVAAFTTSGSSVKVGGAAQVSGVTANNFANPVNFTVTAADNSTATYRVSVSFGQYPGPKYTWTRYLAGGTPGTDMPSARYDYAMAYGGDNAVYVFSGNTGASYGAPDFWKYDLATHVWTSIALAGTAGLDYPSPRFAGSMAYIGGRTIMLFGGLYDTGSYLCDTWEYDTSTGMWTKPGSANAGTEGSDFPSKRSDITIAYIGGTKAMLFGGYSSYSVSAGDTWIYDASSHSWSQYNSTGTVGTDKPEPRYGDSLTLAGPNTVLLTGGFSFGNGDTYFADTWLYDVTSHGWSKIDMTGKTAGTDYPVGRCYAAAAYLGGNYSLLFGGENPSNFSGMSDSWVFNLATKTWTLTNTIAGPGADYSPPMRKAFFMAGSGQGTVLIFGGEDSAVRSDSWEYQ